MDMGDYQSDSRRGAVVLKSPKERTMLTVTANEQGLVYYLAFSVL